MNMATKDTSDEHVRKLLPLGFVTIGDAVYYLAPLELGTS